MQSKKERKNDVWGLTVFAVVIATSYPYARFAMSMTPRASLKFSLYNPLVTILIYVGAMFIAETVAEVVYPGIAYGVDDKKEE